MITALIITGAGVYVFMTAMTVLTALSDWSIHRDLARDYEGQPRWARLQEEHERKARGAARRIMQAPMWPVAVLAVLGRIYRDSKEDR